MPSKSKAQQKLMQAAAHDPKFAKKVGIPTKVAKEFNEADMHKAMKSKPMESHMAYNKRKSYKK